MSSDEENFEAIKAKMAAQKKEWPSRLTKACLDKAIENITPVLEKKLSGKSIPLKIVKDQSRIRGK